jgi:CelD/BcsL family acetyltransferase involved in cellulose biosynthesis
MPAYRLLQHHDASVLRDQRALWNDLWERSAVAAPSARAEQIVNWIDAFAGDAPFYAVTVNDGDRFVAALPLVGRRMKHIVRVGMLPHNEWTSGGDLLVDPAADVDAALDCLCDGVADAPWPLLWLDEIALGTPHWQAFRAALERTGMSFEATRLASTAQVAIEGDWQRYESTRDGDHRRSRRRYAKKLQQAGRLQFDVHSPRDPNEASRLVRLAFEIEDRGWKGAAGSSVAKAGLLEVFERQAGLLAESGNVEFAFLTLDSQPMAFAYCWRAKGVAFIAKLGYDDAFRQYGPGQQLVMHLLERLHGQGDCRLLDFWGRLAPWNQSWATHTYDVSRLVVAPPRLMSRGLLRAYASLCELKSPTREIAPSAVVAE